MNSWMICYEGTVRFVLLNEMLIILIVSLLPGRGDDGFGKSAPGRNIVGAPAPALDGRSDLLKAIRDGIIYSFDLFHINYSLMLKRFFFFVCLFVLFFFLKEYLYEKWRKDRNNRKNVEWMKDCATSPRSWRVGSPWNSQTRIPVRNRDPDRIGMMKRALNSINNSNSSNPNDTPLHFLFTCWLYEI